MVAIDWFKAGWFLAQEHLREDDDGAVDVNTLRRDKAFRMGYREGVAAYKNATGAFMCPKGE